MIKYKGKNPLEAPRLVTGFHSLDYSLQNQWGEVGMPLRSMVEVFGPTGVGKSTFLFTLAGLVNRVGNIALCDLEGFDPAYMERLFASVNFEGSLELIQGLSDEKVLTQLSNAVWDEDTTAAILDSVGAISPISETEGDVGDANMGRRAFLMAQTSRRINRALLSKQTPSIFLLSTHALPNLTGYGGAIAAGGSVKGFLCSIRIKVKSAERWEDGTYTIEGRIEKNRVGIAGQVFHMVCLSGYGFHKGLSAVVDCEIAGIAKRNKGGTVSIGEKSYGRMSKLIEAAYDDPEAFIPFQKALEEVGKEKEKV